MSLVIYETMEKNRMKQNEKVLNVNQQKEDLNLSDIAHIVRINWYWFIISIVGCLICSFIYLQWAPKKYACTATVLIKDDRRGVGNMSEASVFADLGMFSVKSNVDSEILVFQSRQLMRDVVKRLKLDVSYTEKQGLRTNELYTKSPVHLEFPDAEPNQKFSLKVTLVDEHKVVLSSFKADSVDVSNDITTILGDTIQTPIGRVVVAPTLYYTNQYFGKTINVQKKSIKSIANYFSGELEVDLANKMAAVINLTLVDVSVSRAEDLINTLIAIYNEDAINDKNRIMVNTSEFINDRLIIIEKELGGVDAGIEKFKRENRLTDIISETGLYLKENSEYNKAGLGLENQLTLAHYIRNYLTDPVKDGILIPVNTGISDANLESQIGEYNTLLLKRDRLVAGSSNRNPVVMDLNQSLVALRQVIIRSIDNLIVSLDIQNKNIKFRETLTTKRIEAVPGQQKTVLSIERQQKIKEELYLYLLNKREENAISQIITESNTRIIDPATSNESPVAPKSAIILLAGLICGCMLPICILWLINTIDSAVRTRRDVEEGVTIPFLGEIPYREQKKKPFRKVNKNKKEENEIIVRDGGRDAVSEAYCSNEHGLYACEG